MKILEELWLGNVNPQGGDSQKDPRIQRAVFLVEKNDTAMRAMLSDIQKEQYEKFCDCQSDLTDFQERRAFAEGFCLAVKIMMDVVRTMEAPLANG